MAALHALRSGAVAVLAGVDAIVPRARGVTVLAYHRVGAATSIGVDLPREDVARQLDWLVDNATTVSLDAAADLLFAANGHGDADANHPRPVVLTADDGTADWVDTLLPLLVERSLPMTWYVATRFVDERLEFPSGGQPVSWSGLADAVATGLVTVGSHTHSHAVMARLDSATAAGELDRSVALLEDKLGQPCRHFAYPKAIAGSDDADTEVRRRFRTAALAGNRVNVPGRTDPARLGRTPIHRRDDLAAFSRKVRGAARFEGLARERYDRHRHRDAVT